MNYLNTLATKRRTKMNKILLDQTIIVKALYILTEVFDKPNDFITKEMLERLPELKNQEMTKLTLLERQLKK